MCDAFISMLDKKSNSKIFLDILNRISSYNTKKLVKIFKFMNVYFDDLKNKLTLITTNDFNQPILINDILINMLVTFIVSLPKKNLVELFPSSDWDGTFTADNSSLIVRIIHHLREMFKNRTDAYDLGNLKFFISPYALLSRMVFFQMRDDKLLDQMMNYLDHTSRPELYSKSLIKKATNFYGSDPLLLKKKGETQYFDELWGLDIDDMVIKKMSSVLGINFEINPPQDEENGRGNNKVLSKIGIKKLKDNTFKYKGVDYRFDIKDDSLTLYQGDDEVGLSTLKTYRDDSDDDSQEDRENIELEAVNINDDFAGKGLCKVLLIIHLYHVLNSLDHKPKEIMVNISSFTPVQAYLCYESATKAFGYETTDDLYDEAMYYKDNLDLHVDQGGIVDDDHYSAFHKEVTFVLDS